MHDALALSAAELVRIAVEMLAPEADELDELGHARFPFVAAERALDHQALGDDVADLHPLIERSEGVLEDHLEVLAERAQPLARRGEDVFSREEDLAGLRPLQPHDGAAERGLAATGFADEPECLAAADLQRDIVDRFEPFGAGAEEAAADRVIGAKIPDFEQWRARPGFSAFVPARHRAPAQ